MKQELSNLLREDVSVPLIKSATKIEFKSDFVSYEVPCRGEFAPCILQIEHLGTERATDLKLYVSLRTPKPTA